VNKSELVTVVAARLGGTEAEARKYIDTMVDVISGRVAAGERVQVLGFGTFDRVDRKPRVRHNPRTGQPIQVAATRAPRFTAGQTLRNQVADTMTVDPTPVVDTLGPQPIAAEPEGTAPPVVKKPAKKAKASVKPVKNAPTKKAPTKKAPPKKAKAAPKAAKKAENAAKPTGKTKSAVSKAKKTAKPKTKGKK